MKRALLGVFAAVSLLFSLAGCVVDTGPHRPSGREPSGREHSGREQLLGQREVDFRADRDVIEVGQHQGQFQRVRLVVRGAPIEVRDVRVTFGDGSVYDPVSGTRLLREDSAYVFEFPGGLRFIQRISFLYRSVGRQGPATVLVFGEHPRGVPRDARREELLGQRQVDFRVDRDVIEVGQDAGQFQQIRVVVRGAPIEIRDVRVTFGDDSVYDPVSGSRVLREDSAFLFEFPRGQRFIKRISFFYRSIDRREGTATVLVYGVH